MFSETLCVNHYYLWKMNEILKKTILWFYISAQVSWHLIWWQFFLHIVTQSALSLDRIQASLFIDLWLKRQFFLSKFRSCNFTHRRHCKQQNYEIPHHKNAVYVLSKVIMIYVLSRLIMIYVLSRVTMIYVLSRVIMIHELSRVIMIYVLSRVIMIYVLSGVMMIYVLSRVTNNLCII